MKIEQFTKWHYAHSAQADPSGNLIVFQVTKPNLSANNYQTNLWLYDNKISEVRQFSNSDRDGSVLFLENGNLLFSSARKHKQGSQTKLQGTTSYWQINPHGGEAVFEFEIDLKVNKIFELGDDKYLVHGYQDTNQGKDWVEIGDLPFWINEQGYVTGIKSGLYLFDAKLAKAQDKEKENNLGNNVTLASSKVVLADTEPESSEQNSKHKDSAIKQSQLERGILKLITQTKQNVNLVEVAPDNKSVLFSCSIFDKLMPVTEDLYLMDLNNYQQTAISKQEYQIRDIKYLSGRNDQAYLIASDCKKHGLNQDPQIYLVDLNHHVIDRISKPDFDYSVGNRVGTDAKVSGGDEIFVSGDELYFISTSREKAVLRKINPQGIVETVIEQEGAIRCITLFEQTIYFIAMFDLNLPELYSYQNKEITQITEFSRVLSNTELARIEMFQYESNGDLLDGFVIKPQNFQAGKKYPALLEIHGGPKTTYGTILHHELQFLAAQGYFVFYTNPHGSDGYGVEFSDIRGKYGTIDFRDLMNFTDLVLEKYPQIDSDRLGVLGGSYGGFMVNWIISHSDRFKAANSQRSISNWLSFYGVSDIGYFFAQDQTSANPWDNPQDSWQQSPLKYADKITTPTLFIHADHDLRCPLEQGIQMYSALQVNQIDTKLVIFKNENHELSRSGKPQARIKRLAEIKNWFDKYLIT